MNAKEILKELENNGFIKVEQWTNACDYLEIYIKKYNK